MELNRFKTDKADAHKLLSYGMTNRNKAVSYHLPSQTSRHLRDLFTCRKNLTDTRSAYTCRIKDLQQRSETHVLALEIEKQLIKVIDGYIQTIEKAIHQLIAQDKTIKRMYKILISIPCIGPITAWHLLFITDCFEKFDSAKTLAAFIGCAPYPKKSGSSVKHKDRVSKKAYKPLKVDLNQGIVSVCTRPGQLFYEYYQAMIKSNKHHLYILSSIKNVLLNSFLN